MSKYNALYTEVNNVFGSLAWIAEGIKTFPPSFVGLVTSNEYIRVAILASGADPQKVVRSSQGQLSIDIFIPAGAGPKRATDIADRLDAYLVNKVYKDAGVGSLQLGSSTLTPRGNDRDNPSLYRFIYTIPFNFFGV